MDYDRFRGQRRWLAETTLARLLIIFAARIAWQISSAALTEPDRLQLIPSDSAS
jgi:hypothetical protein